MNDRFLDTLHKRFGASLQFKVVAYQHLHCIGDHDRARYCQARYPRGQIGSQPVDLVLGGVQVHESAVHPDPDVDLDREAALAPAR